MIDDGGGGGCHGWGRGGSWVTDDGGVGGFCGSGLLMWVRGGGNGDGG